MKKKVWLSAFFVFAIALFTIFFINKENEVYSEEKCLETHIPCLNAFSEKDKVKVINGTSALDQGNGHFVYGDFFEGDVEREKLDVLAAEKNGVVTLEFINKEPQNMTVYQLDGEEREKEIAMEEYSFIVPYKPGIYKYELFGEYANGTVQHYLKVKVK